MTASLDLRVFRYGFSKPQKSNWRFYVNRNSNFIVKVDRVVVEILGRGITGAVLFRDIVLESFNIGDHVMIKLEKENDAEAKILGFICSREFPLFMHIEWVVENGKSKLNKDLISVCSINQKIAY